MNISACNRSFEEKKAKFGEHTGLFLNKWFAPREKWDESDIRERGLHFARLAPGIWPHIESF